MFLAYCYQFCQKISHFTALGGVSHRPVGPRYFVILAICVVVSPLCAAEFVPSKEHWRTMGKHHGCEHRAPDPSADISSLFIRSCTFYPPIGRIIPERTVVVSFAVGLIVPLCETHHVGKCKAVMGSDIIDRSPRAAGIAVEQIAGAGKSGREFGALAGIATPETSRAVAKTVIPLSKSRRMMT